MIVRTRNIHLNRYCWLVCFSAVLLCNHLQAQNYERAKSGKFILATNGLGIGYSQYIKDGKSLLSADLQTISHPQETNVQNTSIVNPRTYVYAKVNSAASLRFGYTAYKTLSSGSNSSLSPAILIGWTAGPSLGITKPYYVSYQHNRKDGSGTDIIQQNEETINNQDSIFGPVSWTQGFKKLGFTPGAHADVHVAIKWNHSYYLQSCKLGVRFDYFPNQLNILYNAKSQYFTSLYIAYEVGR